MTSKGLEFRSVLFRSPRMKGDGKARTRVKGDGGNRRFARGRNQRFARGGLGTRVMRESEAVGLVGWLRPRMKGDGKARTRLKGDGGNRRFAKIGNAWCAGRG